jgi:hypothetical protein
MTIFLTGKDLSLGFNPPEFNELELTKELWSVTRIAMRNWLKDPPGATVSSRLERAPRSMGFVWASLGLLTGSAGMLLLRDFRGKRSTLSRASGR